MSDPTTGRSRTPASPRAVTDKAAGSPPSASSEPDAAPARPLLLTVEQAAELLNVGRNKIYELMFAGELSSVKIGRCRRVPTTECLRYVEALVASQQGRFP